MTHLQRLTCKRSSITSNLWREKKLTTFVFSLCKALVKLPQPGGTGLPLFLWRLYQTQVCQMREGRNFILKWLRAEAELFQVFLEQMHIDWPPSIKITSLISHQTLTERCAESPAAVTTTWVQSLKGAFLKCLIVHVDLYSMNPHKESHLMGLFMCALRPFHLIQMK